MSLINKMLQDLDARGTGAAALQQDVKPVARDERRLPLPLVLGLVGGAVAIAAAGAFGWRYLQKPPASATFAAKPAVVVMRPAPQVLPAAQPVLAPVATEQVKTAPAVPHADQSTTAGTAVGWAPVPTPEANAKPVPAPPMPKVAPPKPARSGAEIAPKKVALAPPVKLAAVPAHPAVREANPPANARRGEDAYRRALASLQDGRVTETITLLEQGLDLEPRHDAARQTLIGLLVENGRIDEATRQLRLALGINPRQPALAMLLARLQIERGGSGIETLTRTLPYAGGNGEYQAFLAGALQRQGRHAEAAEQYQAALRNASGNGVWWMGLGISLQAAKRDAEALAAFRRAQAAGTLTPELLAFVERKLQQLAR